MSGEPVWKSLEIEERFGAEEKALFGGETEGVSRFARVRWVHVERSLLEIGDVGDATLELNAYENRMGRCIDSISVRLEFKRSLCQDPGILKETERLTNMYGSPGFSDETWQDKWRTCWLLVGGVLSYMSPEEPK